MKFKQIHFDTIPSTNTYLKENYKKHIHGTVVTAKHQTQGRGRMTRTWVDSDDLLMSILLKKNLISSEISQLASVTVASVYTTLKKYIPNLKIKWPNDLVVGKKKIVGLLLESLINKDKLECLIIGIGINVNSKTLPIEIVSRSTSLFLETNQSFSISAIKDEVLSDFDAFYNAFQRKDRSYIKICQEQSCLINKEVIFNDFEKTQEGKVLAILDNGNILVDVNGVEKEFNYGEVSLNDLYKS